MKHFDKMLIQYFRYKAKDTVGSACPGEMCGCFFYVFRLFGEFTFCCLKVTLNLFRKKSFFASCPTLLLLSPSSVKTVGLFPRHCLTCELSKAHCMYFDAVISPANQHIILHCKGRPTGVLIYSLVTSVAALIKFSCLSLTFAAFHFLFYIFGWLFHLLNIQKVFFRKGMQTICQLYLTGPMRFVAVQH